MVKKLTKHGSSLALAIDRPILDLLRIDPETPLDVGTDGKRLIVAPAKPSAGDIRRRISAPLNSSHGRGAPFPSLPEPRVYRRQPTGRGNAAITFLLMNGWIPSFDDGELADLVFPVASGVLNKTGLTEIFKPRCAPR
jgi:hypothetical protein